MALMESPVCLIENTNGKLQVDQDAISFLMGLSQPVVVVAVVGLYRTGKSYLMNKLAGKKNGFALGATIQSKTKGIWMWALPHPTKPGHTLVLLDTEGLGDVEKGDQTNDAWIFSLAILLSSTLVYNSRGTIDNQALENLQYVTELTERIKVKSSSSASAEEIEDGADAQFVQFFPSFVWAVRDFTLELELDGRKVNEDQYLEHALSLRKGKDRKTLNYNLPRECIRNYFPSRRCFVFVTPASSENMPRLESMDERDLNPAFLNVTSSFCRYIFEESSVKTVKGGLPVTGRMLGHLAKTYVETIAKGNVPCLENAVLAMAQIENEAAVRDGLTVYQDGMKDLAFPVGIDEISKQHRHWDNLATKAFMSRSFKDEDGKYLKDLAEAITKHYSALLTENEEASERYCRQLLTDLSAPMAGKLQQGFYAKPGGYELYCGDHDNIVAQFRSQPNKGVKAEEVLEQFLKEKSVESNSILQADNKLTDQEKKIHEEKERAALLEQEKKAAEEKRLEMERTLQEERQSQEEKLRMMQDKMEEEMKKQREESERAIECKLLEQRDLLEKGFKEKADILNEEIRELREKSSSASSGNFFTNTLLPLLSHGLQTVSSIYQFKALKKGIGF
ncbi:guanylate-binding protein 1-like [Megalops cyprinoides]|uniref:guanylate-binding protein 1-like n=1 Tax=Megalops cyprinoides TaxID=118141 RepID=UPI001864489A|nr:guanylate-binding protein 1-like [Megalops cyprinoides]